MGDVFFSFINEFIQSFICNSMDLRLFYTSGYNPIPLYFVAQVFQLQSLGALSDGSIIVVFFNLFCFVGHFLTFWHYKILQTHLVCLLLSENQHFSKKLCFRHWRLVLETEARVLGVLAVTKYCFWTLSADVLC